MNDMRKTQMQATGSCDVRNLTVIEIAEIVSDLGLDPRTTRVRSDRLYVSEYNAHGRQVGDAPMTIEEAQTRAIMSLLDVVEELAVEVGEPNWADMVRDSFKGHRNELRDPEGHSV